MLGIQAIVGSVWWILILFVSIQNQANVTLQSIDGKTVLPIQWWWENVQQTSSAYLALSLAATFFLYLGVSFMEMISWFHYLRGHVQLARFYFAYLGYWGSVVGYAIPPIFAFIQLCYKGSDVFPGSWAVL